jgi:Flp pilus assembly protein CpaB
MHRSPRVIAAWVVAALVALVTARVVAGDLSTLHARARSLGRDVPVVIAARDLQLGATLSARDVRVVTRPSSTVAPDALRDPERVAGRVLAIPLLRDDVVRESHLAPADRSGLDGVVPVGKRAAHVVVKDGFRPPIGAVVDVLASFDPSVAGSRQIATSVARGARVLATDDPADTASGAGAGVTLLIAANEVPAVAYANGNGQVSVVLAPPEQSCCPDPSSEAKGSP